MMNEDMAYELARDNEYDKLRDLILSLWREDTYTKRRKLHEFYKNSWYFSDRPEIRFRKAVGEIALSIFRREFSLMVEPTPEVITKG